MVGNVWVHVLSQSSTGLVRRARLPELGLYDAHLTCVLVSNETIFELPRFVKNTRMWEIPFVHCLCGYHSTLIIFGCFHHMKFISLDVFPHFHRFTRSAWYNSAITSCPCLTFQNLFPCFFNGFHHL